MSSQKHDVSLKKREVLKNSCGKQQSERDESRRGFLNRSLGVIGATVTTVIAFSDAVLAKEESKRELARSAASEYGSKYKVREAAQECADGLVEALAQQGYLKEASITALPLENYFTTLKQYSEASDGVFVFGTVNNGQPRTKIQIKKQLSDNQELRLVITPQEARSQAILISDLFTGEHISSITPTKTDSEDVTTQSCDCLKSTSECYTYCNSVGSCSCAERTVGDNCTKDDGSDCTFCTIDYSSCSSCNEVASCP